MADISSQIDTIRRSDRGENVRDAITSALQAINNDTPYPDPESLVIQMQTGSDYHQTGGPWDEVTVLQPGSGGKTTELKELIVSDNNTEWPRDEDNYDPDKQQIYYSKVKVKVNQLANDVLMEPVTITQNGEYSATEWGVDGLRNIIVDIQGAASDGPFTVEFYNKPIGDPSGVVIHIELVAKGGSATCRDLDGTYDSVGNGFKGWSPSPSNVTRDMKCYPTYGDVVITPGSIEDDWSVIALDGGAHYPLQSHKSVNWAFQTPAITVGTYCGTTIDIPAGNVSMQLDFYKVAEGESGSHSTWLSDNHITVTGINVNASAHNGQGPNTDWWGNSPIKQWLNNALIAGFPDALKYAIKEVTKTSIHYVNGVWIDETSTDRIWIPSAKEYQAMYEALIPTSSMIQGGWCPGRVEYTGIDYTSIFMSIPPLNGGTRLLRSWGMGNTAGNLDSTTSLVSNGVDLYKDVTRNIGKINSDINIGYVIGFCL